VHSTSQGSKESLAVSTSPTQPRPALPDPWYAAKRGLEIVHSYADEGKSGLRIDGRQALHQVIKDVDSGRTDFQVVLVNDASSWGTFQDVDESAYYEYSLGIVAQDVCRPVLADRAQLQARRTD